MPPKENPSTAPKKHVRRKHMKNQPIKSKPSRFVGEFEVKEWQRLPSQLLEQYCQKNSVDRPRIKGNQGFIHTKKGTQRIRCLRACTDPDELYEFVALHVLYALAPDKPMGNVPTAFQEEWSSLEGRSKAKHSKREEWKAPQKSAKPSKSYAKLDMSESVRQHITSILRELDSSSSAPRSNSSKHKYTTLSKKGFRQVDVEFAAAALCDAASYDTVLDYLLVHLPESELPDSFDPRIKELKVTSKGFLEKNAERRDTIDALKQYGFPIKAIVQALETYSDTDACLVSLFELFYRHLGVYTPSEAYPIQLDEEMEACEAIYGPGFKRQSHHRWSINLDTVRIEFIALASYPHTMPALLLHIPKISPSIKLTLVQTVALQCLPLLGEPLVFDIIEHIKSIALATLSPLSLSLPPEWRLTLPSATTAPKSAKAQKRRPKLFSKLKRDTKVDKALEQDLERREKLPAYQRMLQFRSSLPIFGFRSQILDGVVSPVFVLSANTGSGKSTQVGQFILDSMIQRGDGSLCRIYCTQPRRISTVSLADRIVQERADTKVGAQIGYQIRLDSSVSRESRLVFCTNGILLRKLMEDPFLKDTSHVIVDEVHERSAEIDTILLMLRFLVQSRKRPDLRIVLMSATLNADALSRYFDGAPILQVPGRTFPVHVHHLEDVLEKLGPFHKELGIPDSAQAQQRLIEKKARQVQSYTQSTRCSDDIALQLCHLKESSIAPELVAHILFRIMASYTRGAILVFVSGIAPISAITRQITCIAPQYGVDASTALWVLGLHSSTPPKEQQQIFQTPPKSVWKIIVATNIAETSITVPDVVYVVDTGRVNLLRFDTSKNMDVLAEDWESQANAIQRQGRAGRVQSGTCFRLVTSWRFEQMDAHHPPELQRTALDRVGLQLKLIGMQLEERAKIRVSLPELFAAALDPPSPHVVDLAITELERIGALHTSPRHETLTPLGLLLAQLPLPSAKLGKLLLYATLLGCLTPVLVICALMAERSPLQAPTDKRDEAAKAHAEFKALGSDHVTLANAFKAWFNARPHRAAFCRDSFVNDKTMSTALKTMRQYLAALRAADFIDDGVSCTTSVWSSSIAKALGIPPFFDRHSANPRVIQSLLCAGLYPNIVRVRLPETKYLATVSGTVQCDHESRQIKFYDEGKRRVFLHPGSMLFGLPKFSSPWLVYLQKRETSKVYLYDCSIVPPAALVLFGGELAMDRDRDHITVDSWIKLDAAARIGVLSRDIRHHFDALLLAKFKNPRLHMGESKLVEAIICVLDNRIY